MNSGSDASPQEKGQGYAGDVLCEGHDLGGHPTNCETIDIRKAFSKLASYSLITREVNTFTVHRIIQEVIRAFIPEESHLEWLKKSLDIINKYAPTDADDVRTWDVWNPLYPHVEVMVNHADRADIKVPTTRLMNNLGRLFFTKALYSEAEPLMRRALEIDEKAYRPNHPDVAIHLGNLGSLLQTKGKPEEGKQLLERALAIFEKSFPPDHPHVLETKRRLATFKIALRLVILIRNSHNRNISISI